MDESYLIFRSAKQFAEKPCIIFEDKIFTFREVNERVNSIANALLKIGLNKGDKVAVLQNNCHQEIESFFALSKGGMIKVPIMAMDSIEEIKYKVNDSEANTIILGPEFIDKIGSIRDEIKGIKNYICLDRAPSYMLDYEELISSSSSAEPTISTSDEDLHSIHYTSGTTALPKGVMMTYKTRNAVLRNFFIDTLSIQPTDVMLHPHPLTHAAGSYVLPHMIRGCANVILPKFDPELLLRAVEKYKVTTVRLVPTALIRLLEYPDIRKFDFSTLHTIYYGASPMPTDKLIKLIKIFGQIFIQIFGQSESPSCICYLPKHDHVIEGRGVEKLGSVGRPFTDVRVRIVNDSGQDISPGEEVGEVIVKSDTVVKGYWKRPDLTAETIVDGWLHTGDLARIDQEGYIYLVDRKKDVIVTGGFNVAPKEVENVIYSHPAVLEVAVVGVPDEKWGEAVKAAVVLKQGAEVSEKEIIDFCEGKLAAYKKPKSIDFYDNELPKSPAGKILRRAVKEKYWKGLGKRIQ